MSISGCKTEPWNCRVSPLLLATNKIGLSEIINKFIARILVSIFQPDRAGNHELGLDPTAGRGATYNMAGGKRDECLKSITDCIFLEDHWVKINGIKIYGSPWFVRFYFIYFFF